jgi:hypothetical protein
MYSAERTLAGSYRFAAPVTLAMARLLGKYRLYYFRKYTLGRLYPFLHFISDSHNRLLPAAIVVNYIKKN